MEKTLCTLTVLLLGLQLFVLDARAQMESASYRILTSVLSGGGEAMASATYRINATNGQSSPVGHISSTNSSIASGFWHIWLEAVIDSDGDGIDDNWEMLYFGKLTTANATTDFDRDGYSDLQEYLNDLASETDPKGRVYNPKVKNAPGGTGYDPRTVSNILFLFLPAVFDGSQEH